MLRPDFGSNKLTGKQDIAMSLGLIPSPTKTIALGMEVSGVVRRAGSCVTNVSVGDRICALGKAGLFASVIVIQSSLAVKIPDDLSFEDAATMPACFATVIRSLVDVGQLEKDQVSALLMISG
jgi:NADPH:quinone reductase-like Zn-dependent oxidoreductase